MSGKISGRGVGWENSASKVNAAAADAAAADAAAAAAAATAAADAAARTPTRRVTLTTPAAAGSPPSGAAAGADAAPNRTPARRPTSAAAAVTTPAYEPSPTHSSVKASIARAKAEAEARHETTPYSIAKDAMYQNLEIKFPEEWWSHHRGGEGYKRKQPNKTLQQRQHEFNTYEKANQESYRTFMGKLKDLDGFVRIVTQNMHCRDKGLKTASACAAEFHFTDNQKERAIEFAKRIKSGTVDAHVIAIQELQDSNSKKAFITELRGTNYATWFPNSGVYITEGLLGRAVDAAGDVAAEYPGGGAAGAGLLAAAAVASAAGRLIEISAGQGFVWDTNKVKLIQKEFLLYPREISSGADTLTAGTGTHSFKAVAFAQFQLLKGETATSVRAAGLGLGGAKFSVFNIHPSPYVSMEDIGILGDIGKVRSKYEIDIVASHLYQFTLTANRIKEHLKANRDDYVFVCGDWNVNKYFQNGFSETGTREDIKEQEKIAAKAASEAAKKAALDSGMSEEQATKIGKDFAKAKKPLVARGFKKEGNGDLPRIIEDEPCFRDDIPFTNKKECDFYASGGSEYMTVSEILGTIPPTHLFSISEHETDIPAPYGGKYTWDGLLNSVMYSPHWSGKAFQLLDHIVYSKYGKIPIYAHTMTKRYLTTEPVPATEGPLSAKCRKKRLVIDKLPKTAGHLQPYTRKEVYTLEEIGLPGGGVGAEEINILYDQYRYVDIADHYGVECIAILDNKPTTISNLADLVGNFYPKAKFWIDPFFPQNNLDILCELAKAHRDARRANRRHRTRRAVHLAEVASRLEPTTLFDKAQIPKLWELLSTTQSYPQFSAASRKLDCGGIEKKYAISNIIERYIQSPDPTDIMTYIPENINKKYILNQYVLKMANRLIEREYINRVQFTTERRAREIPFAKFNCTKTGDMLYDCRLTRKIRKSMDERRGAKLKLAANRFSKKVDAPNRSPVIITNEAGMTPGRRKSIKLSRRGTFIPAPANVERKDAAAVAAEAEAARAAKEANVAEYDAEIAEERAAGTRNNSRLMQRARQTRRLANAARERVTKAREDLVAARAAQYPEEPGFLRRTARYLRSLLPGAAPRTHTVRPNP